MSEKILPERFYTKTVYGLRLPEFNETIRKAQQSDVFLKRHEKPWLKYQDDYHIDFSETYKKWMKDSVSGLNQFNYFYPSNGSSEAIKDTINYLDRKHWEVEFFAFNGEYEGYEAYCKSYGNHQVNYIDRNEWAKSIDHYTDLYSDSKRIFFISQPSSIDGDNWKDFNKFVRYLKANNWIVCVDLAYMPLAETNYIFDGMGVVVNINTYDLKDVDFVFISLSKSFGVYYNRIGGVYSKCEIPSLYGNQWFKNVDSLYIGIQLMNEFHSDQLSSLFSHYLGYALKTFKEYIPDNYLCSNSRIIAKLSDVDNYKDFVRKGSDVARLRHP